MTAHRRLLILLAVLALAITGCGGAGPTAPEDVLLDALQRTLGGSFSFEVTLDADDAAQDAIAAEDPRAAALLRTLELAGRHDDGGVALGVHAFGLDVADIVSTAEETFHLRVDPEVVALVSQGETSVDDLLAGLGGLPEALRAPAETLLAGEWVGIDGAEARELSERFGGLPLGRIDEDEVRASFREHFGSLRQFVRDDLEIVEAGDGVYDVAFRARDAARKFAGFAEDLFGGVMGPMAGAGEEGGVGPTQSELAELPETLPGMRLTVAERMIQRVELDVFTMLRAGGEHEVPAGELRVVAVLADHGTVEPVEAPADATMLDLEALLSGSMLSGPPQPTEDEVEAEEEALPSGGEFEGTGPEHAAVVLKEAQLSRQMDGMDYTADAGDLVEDDPSLVALAESGLLIGTCTYDAGEQNVVAASDGQTTVYYDSIGTAPTTEPVGLGCVPELVDRG